MALQILDTAADACAVPPGAGEARMEYDDAYLLGILSTTRTIAMVGASPNWNRPSYFVMQVPPAQGLPGHPGQPASPRARTILGETRLRRTSHDDPGAGGRRGRVPARRRRAGHRRRGHRRSARKVVWLQLGVRNPEAAARAAEAAGPHGRPGPLHEDRVRPAVAASSPGAAIDTGIVISSRRRRLLGMTRRGRRGHEPPTAGQGGRTAARATASRRAPSTPARPRNRSPAPATCPSSRPPSYVFEDVDHAASLFNLQTFGYIYSRITNPTVAALEGGSRASRAAGPRSPRVRATPRSCSRSTRCSSPATISSHRGYLYGGSLTQFTPHLPAARLDVHASSTRATRLPCAPRSPRGRSAIFIESLSNPGGVVVDLEPLADGRREAGDPARRRQHARDAVPLPAVRVGRRHRHPLADQVPVRPRHLDGRHRRRVRPVRLGRERQVPVPDRARSGLPRARRSIETFGDFGFSMKARAVALRDLGPALSPTNAFHILTGIETLPLRMERHGRERPAPSPLPGCASGRGLGVLPGPADRARPTRSRAHTCPAARVPCSRSACGAASRRASGSWRACDLWSHLANVGDTRSLIIHPASTTHRQLTDEQRAAAGAGHDVIRLSVGIETVDDLIADLDQALAVAATA